MYQLLDYPPKTCLEFCGHVLLALCLSQNTLSSFESRLNLLYSLVELCALSSFYRVCLHECCLRTLAIQDSTLSNYLELIDLFAISHCR